MNQSIDIPDRLNLDILKAFGIEKAPQEWEKFLALAGEAILTSVVRRIKDHLPEEKQEEFFWLFETPSSDEEKAAFFKTYVPNFQELLLEETAHFKKEALEYGQKTA